MLQLRPYLGNKCIAFKAGRRALSAFVVGMLLALAFACAGEGTRSPSSPTAKGVASGPVQTATPTATLGSTPALSATPTTTPAPTATPAGQTCPPGVFPSTVEVLEDVGGVCLVKFPITGEYLAWVTAETRELYRDRKANFEVSYLEVVAANHNFDPCKVQWMAQAPFNRELTPEEALTAGCVTPTTTPAPTSTPTPTVTPTPSLPLAGRIAFYSHRDGNGEIYVMNADGSGQTNLTNNPAQDEEITWSPDGSKIAFISFRDGNEDIYVMNADGSGQTRLTNNPGRDWIWTPAWSPDGSKIAFTLLHDGVSQVYVMDADGSQQLKLATDGYVPFWSPDGSKIAFVSSRDGNEDIYVMNADGTGQTNLTRNPAQDLFPSPGPSPWSADGSRIAFISNSKIYVMNADGSSPIRLTTDEPEVPPTPPSTPGPPGSLEDWPAWSPDGSRIAFTSTRDYKTAIYVVNASGSQEARLVAERAGAPTWSPDGSSIAFVSGASGNAEVYTCNADGTAQTSLTQNPAEDGSPAWSPSAAMVASSLFTGPGVSLELLDPKLDGLAVTLDGSAQSSVFDIARIVWDWGDGTAEESWFPGRHSYTEPGRYTLTVRVYDATGTEIAGQSGPVDVGSGAVP